MPFDAAVERPDFAHIVKARDRMIALRNYLMDLPNRQFDMSTWYGARNNCGTVACIGGWTAILFDLYYEDSRVPSINTEYVGQYIGLSPSDAWKMFYPPAMLQLRGSATAEPYHASPAQAVKVIDHYLATGEVDWRAAYE